MSAVYYNQITNSIKLVTLLGEHVVIESIYGKDTIELNAAISILSSNHLLLGYL